MVLEEVEKAIKLYEENKNLDTGNMDGGSIILYYFAKPEYYFAAGVASLSMDASSGPGMHLIARSRPRSGRGA